MVSKKKPVEPLRKDMPVYTIGVASQLLDVHPRTLRIYEEEGLIKPHRQGTRRLYSPNDVQWVSCLRSLIHDQGISIPGIRKLLRFATCYEISDCPEKIHCNCDAVVDKVIPKRVRLVSGQPGEDQAGDAEREERRLSRLRKKSGKQEAGDELKSGEE
ncbi:MerR family transcriptional regulator [Desulfopila sp. IMCC35008]|uniref:MerR family transcriptional regulator n=1 Tax=Desulfopila sp. IMCC35008 TaxID=2653858 RepID=UPI00197A84CD|nr:MerR family transcriptional regulator [Desulfopila sp. IMCC35008]